MWSICGQLILLMSATLGTRAFGVYLASKAEQDKRIGDIDAVKGDSLTGRLRAATILGLVVFFAIGLLALVFLADTQTDGEAMPVAAVTNPQTLKAPASYATLQQTPTPLVPRQATPTPADSANVVINQSKRNPLESDSQNLRPDTALSKAEATYRVFGVTTGDFLNMRQGPGKRYPVIQRLQDGVDGVILIGDPIRNGSTKWQKINSRGVVGWGNAVYLVPSSDGRDAQGVVAPIASDP